MYITCLNMCGIFVVKLKLLSSDQNSIKHHSAASIRHDFNVKHFSYITVIFWKKEKKKNKSDCSII